MNQPQPLGDMQAPTPMTQATSQEPVSTAIPGQPLESQGMPTGQVPGAEQMATPEQKQELISMLEATREKYAELQSTKFSSENQGEVARVDALKEIFVMMQDAGVELNDPASVSAFLDKLRSVNPTMADQFEDTLEDLLSEEMPPESQQMGQNPASFNEAAPTRGIPEQGMPMPPLPPPVEGPGPMGAPAPASGTPNLNETVPQEIRGPLQG